MDTTRQQKISRLVQKELSEIFRRETAKTHGTLVSVSSVRVSPDLSVANVRLSIFPSENAQAIMDNINQNERGIRHQLAQQVRYQLRRCPELKFHIDDSLDYIDHIDQLLAKDKVANKDDEKENDTPNS
ncbi:MAG: 30S ribosome-binding factor RbfA [Muribaculaceae bacterium]|nr:30S ribosome-binding factor RbfA [Muribaculaceae bacterium]